MIPNFKLPGDGILDSGDLVSLHGCLQRVDGVNLGDDDTAAETAQGHGAALADISVAGNKSDLHKIYNCKMILNTMFKIQFIGIIVCKIY